MISKSDCHYKTFNQHSIDHFFFALEFFAWKCVIVCVCACICLCNKNYQNINKSRTKTVIRSNLPSCETAEHRIK